MKKTRILIIDDEEAVRNSLGVYLEDSGFGVLEAPDGHKGFALFEAHQPDLILLDLRMPEMDGLEFLSGLPRQGASSCWYFTILPILPLALLYLVHRKGTSILSIETSSKHSYCSGLSLAVIPGMQFPSCSERSRKAAMQILKFRRE